MLRFCTEKAWLGGIHGNKFDNKSPVSSQECSRGNCLQICLMQIGYLKTGPFTIILVRIFYLLKNENKMFGVKARFHVLSRLQRVWNEGEWEVRPTHSCCLLMHR